jgi:starch-binding outer membrane protein SusE/F
MKIILKYLFIPSVFFSFILASCDKKENKIYLEGGTAPVLTSTVSDSVPLSNATASNTALTLSWTNPNYQFTTGVSSQDVSYQLEIDTTGSNFTNPGREIISISKDLSISFSQSQLNDYLLNQLQLMPGVPHNLAIRITSFLANSTVPLVSNVLQVQARPYTIPPKVTPPASGTLYIVGSAVPGGWSNPVTDPAGQKFTQVNPTDYQLTTAIVGDGEYKLISVNGLWDSDKQWSIQTEQPSGDPSTLNYDLYPNGGNARAPLVSGTYKIDVDFQRGKVTFTKQ